jgi:hypothetical protein
MDALLYGREKTGKNTVADINALATKITNKQIRKDFIKRKSPVNAGPLS